MSQTEKKRSATAGTWRKGVSGNPAGRPKGAKNKATVEIQTFARQALTDPEYRASVYRRLAEGTAGQLESLLHHYAFGKPPDKVELTGSDGEPLGPLVAVYVPDNGRGDRSGRDDG